MAGNSNNPQFIEIEFASVDALPGQSDLIQIDENRIHDLPEANQRVA